MKICEWCSGDFKPNVSYQIYCSSDCRIGATKEKVSARYKIKRRKALNKNNRKCKGGCETVLSIYNESGFCYSCVVSKRGVEKALKELKGLIDYERFE